MTFRRTIFHGLFLWILIFVYLQFPLNINHFCLVLFCFRVLFFLLTQLQTFHPVNSILFLFTRIIDLKIFHESLYSIFLQTFSYFLSRVGLVWGSSAWIKLFSFNSALRCGRSILFKEICCWTPHQMYWSCFNASPIFYLWAEKCWSFHWRRDMPFFHFRIIFINYFQ